MPLGKYDASSGTENTLVHIRKKYTLTIKEVASYFYIGRKKMRRLAKDNLENTKVYCGNRFSIIRPKFGEFILNSLEI